MFCSSWKWLCFLHGIFLVFSSCHSVIAVPDDVTFPAPVRSGGVPLFSALQAVRSTGQFEKKLIHWEIIGNLLWSGFGINRPSQDGRTTPQLGATRFLDVYLLAGEGVWRYVPAEHRLIGLLSADLRAFVDDKAVHLRGQSKEASASVVRENSAKRLAPIVLLFVAPQPAGTRRFSHSSASVAQEHLIWGFQAGHSAQNMRLFAVSEGLGTKLHAALDKEELSKKLNLHDADSVLLAISVGYPAPM